MILVDTSVWVDHIRKPNAGLVKILEKQLVLTHPFVIGELACGNLTNRQAILTALSRLPKAKTAHHDEALRFIEQRRLWGSGVGWIDVHLLAAALVSQSSFWTLDKQLQKVARSLDVATP